MLGITEILREKTELTDRIIESVILKRKYKSVSLRKVSVPRMFGERYYF